MNDKPPCFTIRDTQLDDIDGIFALYLSVARIPGGLARLESELSKEYVSGFVSSSVSRGLSLVIVKEGKIVGEVHAYTPGLFCFDHVLSDLTIAIHPDAQGMGAGRQLFEAFMKSVETSHPTILRVELIARESNQKAIRFYESLGFSIEGSFSHRIRNLDGSLESDIPMAWLRNQ